MFASTTGQSATSSKTSSEELKTGSDLESRSLMTQNRTNVETNSWKEFKCRSTGRRNRNGGMKLLYTVNGARRDGWVKHGRPRLIGKEKFQLNQLGERDDKTRKSVTETRTRTRTSAPACLCPAG